MTQALGGCLCGRTRYGVRAQPIRVTICHCRFCQRATGGAYMVEPVFDESDFSLTDGEVKTYEHLSEGSGKKIFIHFCDSCGTKQFLTFERFSGVVGVYGGTFDDPDWYERTPANSKQIFLSAAQRGATILPGVNAFENYATTKDGIAIEPKIYSEAKIIK